MQPRLTLISVKKGKARKYLKLANANQKRKPRVIAKYRALKLTDFKKATENHTIGAVKFVTKIVAEPIGIVDKSMKGSDEEWEKRLESQRSFRLLHPVKFANALA